MIRVIYHFSNLILFFNNNLICKRILITQIVLWFDNFKFVKKRNKLYIKYMENFWRFKLIGFLKSFSLKERLFQSTRCARRIFRPKSIRPGKLHCRKIELVSNTQIELGEISYLQFAKRENFIFSSTIRYMYRNINLFIGIQ